MVMLLFQTVHLPPFDEPEGMFLLQDACGGSLGHGSPRRTQALVSVSLSKQPRTHIRRRALFCTRVAFVDVCTQAAMFQPL